LALPAFGGRIEPFEKVIDQSRVGRNLLQPKAGQHPAEATEPGHLGLTVQALGDMCRISTGKKSGVVQ
jgi:hypothetical protein